MMRVREVSAGLIDLRLHAGVNFWKDWDLHCAAAVVWTCGKQKFNLEKFDFSEKEMLKRTHTGCTRILRRCFNNDGNIQFPAATNNRRLFLPCTQSLRSF